MPRPTGETFAGDPVYAVRSARLVLRGDAAHFNRLVACSSCGRDVVGPAVLAPGDLDLPAEPAACDDCLAKGIAPSTPATPPPVDHRLEDVDLRVAELAASVAGLQAERDGAGEARADAFQGELAVLASAVDELTRGQADLGATVRNVMDRLDEAAARPADSRVEEVASRLEELQAELASGLGRITADLAQLAATYDELASEHASGAHRAQAVEVQVDEVVDRLRRLEAESVRTAGQVAETLAAQRQELQAVVDGGLAEIRAAATAPNADVAARMEALGKRMERNAGEMSELGELHAALDVGMGALRSEIIEVRSALTRVASDQADVEDRLEAFVRGPAAAPDPTRGRKGRKGETGAQAGAVLAFTEDLARELQQLKAHVATLQQASDAATATAARASSQAAASTPFRSDVRALQDQVAAQDEAIAGLRRRLDTLAGKGAGPAPAAAKASRPSKKG